MSVHEGEEGWQGSFIRSAPNASLARKVGQALRELLDQDAHLFVADANERAITGAFARHLTPKFPDWNVDTEYNRDRHEIKKSNGDIVVPDVIVHHRGTPDNLLVIEVKKSTTKKLDDEDLAKLERFKSCPLHYRYALFAKLIVGPEGPGVERIQWVMAR